MEKRIDPTGIYTRLSKPYIRKPDSRARVSVIKNGRGNFAVVKRIDGVKERYQTRNPITALREYHKTLSKLYAKNYLPIEGK